MIAIHQSQFLPWLPYFYKMFQSDVFVVLDDVQFQKNGVQNRNMIKTAQGVSWLTVPVSRSSDTPINEVGIADQSALKKILKSIELNYRRCRFFEIVYAPLSRVLSGKYASLHELNMELLHVVLSLMDKKPNILMASKLGTTMKKDDLVLEVIQKLGEKHYISGQGGLEYMDMSKFKNAGIDVHLCRFNYVEYPQQWGSQGGFIKDMSIIDLLFNDLENAGAYIMANGSLEKAVF